MTEKDAAMPAQTSPGDAMDTPDRHSATWQTGVGAAVALAALWLAWGAWQIPAQPMLEDGGARLVPGLCAAVLLLCGGWLTWEARHGGWRHLSADHGTAAARLTPWVWVSAGLLLSALLIRQAGFVVAAALCYVLALQGLRAAAQPGVRVQAKRLLVDGVTGLLLALVVYLLYTRVLQIGLPAGWLTWM